MVGAGDIYDVYRSVYRSGNGAMRLKFLYEEFAEESPTLCTAMIALYLKMEYPLNTHYKLAFTAEEIYKNERKWSKLDL